MAAGTMRRRLDPGDEAPNPNLARVGEAGDEGFSVGGQARRRLRSKARRGGGTGAAAARG